MGCCEALQACCADVYMLLLGQHNDKNTASYTPAVLMVPCEHTQQIHVPVGSSHYNG